MRPLLVNLFLALCVGWSPASANAEQPEHHATVNVVVTPGPEYSFRNPESGRFEGRDIETLRELTRQAGVTPNFEEVSWARAFRRATEEPGTMILPLTRTEARENDFIWVHKLREAGFAIFSSEPVDLSEFVKTNLYGPWKVLCAKGGIQCTFPERMGVPIEHVEAFPGATYSRLSDLALRKRIRFFIAEEKRVKAYLASKGFSEDALHVVARYPHKVPDYIAVQKDTAPEIVEALGNAARKMETAAD